MLEVYTDYVCPYCWLAEAPLRRLLADGVVLERRAFELRPAGTPLPEPDAPWMRWQWEQTVVPLARAFGVQLRYPSLMTRTRKAHEAAAFARSEGALEEMHEALYRAYWEDGRDIGRIDVLVEIGAGIGLDRGGLRVALDIDQWTERVLEDRAGAERLGLAGVPAYAARSGTREGVPVWGEIRSGLQRYEELQAWVMTE